MTTTTITFKRGKYDNNMYLTTQGNDELLDQIENADYHDFSEFGFVGLDINSAKITMTEALAQLQPRINNKYMPMKSTIEILNAAATLVFHSIK